MKINKIYISAFGKLKDFTLEFSDGLNVVYGNNEDGKSTVFAFIKSTFYGTGRNSKNLSDSIRHKYTPWDNSQMGGRIYFENNNKRYCIEREFRKSDATDRIILTDLDSGKSVTTNENVGVQIFGMSASAFEHSLFIGNGDFTKDENAAGEINGKLSNVAITGDEDVSYKKIEKNLLDARTKLISKNGKSGSYNEDLRTLDLLNERLKKADDAAKTKAALHQKAENLRAEYESLYKNYIELKSLAERKHDYENREQLKEFLNTKQKLDELNASLTLSDGTLINENFTQKIEFGIQKYKMHLTRCSQIEEDVATAKRCVEMQNNSSRQETQNNINNLTAKQNELQNKKSELELQQRKVNDSIQNARNTLNNSKSKKSVFPAVLLISALLFCAGGVVAYVLNQTVITLSLLLPAVLLFALSFVTKSKSKSTALNLQNQIANLSVEQDLIKTNKDGICEQINALASEINLLTANLNADETIKNQYRADLNQKTELLQAEEKKKNTAFSELLSALEIFGNVQSIENAEDLLEKLKQKTERQKALKLKLKTQSQFLNNIDYAVAEQKLAEIQNNLDFENIDFDTVNSKLEGASQKLSNLKDNLTEIATQLKTSFRDSENPEDIKKGIEKVTQTVNSKKTFCDCADIALGVLEESFYELRRTYGSELEKLTHSIFAHLTDDAYSSVSIDKSFDISVEKSNVFGTREIGYLSVGATHQAYLSLRLAIATLISKEEPLPVILDDSLSQYDDARTKNAMVYLKTFCNERQGILFTCHNSLCNIANECNINVLKPYN